VSGIVCIENRQNRVCIQDKSHYCAAGRSSRSTLSWETPDPDRPMPTCGRRLRRSSRALSLKNSPTNAASDTPLRFASMR
jgi:hypothetical protein